MDSTKTRKISAIINNAADLELVISRLTQTTVAQHDVSVQAQTNDIFAEENQFKKPEHVQNIKNSVRKEPYLKDDFGWLLGFTFSIPLFVGIVIGIFFIGDLQSTADNFYYGICGGIVGGVVGFILSWCLKTKRQKNLQRQENKGGFVIWVTTHEENQLNQVKAILNEYNAHHIKIDNTIT